MNPPAVPRPPGWASARLARRVSIWAVPRPPGVGGLPGRLPFHRLVRPLVRDAALYLDHGGGPTSIGSHGPARAAGDGAVVPGDGGAGDGGAAPGGGRRRGGCATPATASRAPLPPRSRPGS